MAYDAGDLLIRAVMTAVSGLPEDTIINDWAVKHRSGAPTDGQIGDAFAAVGDFYRQGASVDARIGSWISDQVDRGATHELQAFTIVAGPLGSPRLTSAWLGPTSNSSSNNLPTEVAGVLSFHADLTGILEEAPSSRPRARRRGRVYIGPLVGEAVSMSSPAPALVSAFTSAMRSNATVMFDALDADGWDWCVWSRADAVLRPVVGGWTDDAPDIQRRRGQAATSRTTFTT